MQRLDVSREKRPSYVIDWPQATRNPSWCSWDARQH